METSGLLLPRTTSDGVQIVTQTYSDYPDVTVWKIRKFKALKGQTTFFDIEITTEKRLAGGDFEIKNPTSVNENDYMEFSIVDKNNVLGLFQTYGLKPGIDILELHKFIRTAYIPKNGIKDFYSHLGCTFAVYAGLFLRISYSSFGTTDINFNVLTMWLE